jgi:uncharacterized protein YecE (DUF72 family)
MNLYVGTSGYSYGAWKGKSMRVLSAHVAGRSGM